MKALLWGTSKVICAILESLLIPSLSEIKIIFAPLAETSSILEAVFENKSSDGARATTGTPSSTRAMGPCFNSPAA